MIDLEPELQTVRPQLGDATANALIARERREIFSIHPELRIAGWLGATMLATAAGIVLKNNLERIGPVALAFGMGIAAAACYAFVIWRRDRASVVDDYILLLGALLVSADVAFIESQFHLLGDRWKAHLLLIALFHAIGAYAFGSRMLLSLSITALTSAIGVSRDVFRVDQLSMPAFLAAAVLLSWRMFDLRFPSLGRVPGAFTRTFEHFAANIALMGALTLTFENDTRLVGVALTVAVAAGVLYWGFVVGEESFALYGFLYALIAVDILLIDLMNDAIAAALVVIVSVIAAIAVLLVIHARFKEKRA